MKVSTRELMIAGPVGTLQTLNLWCESGPVRGIALVAHPNPQQGGTNQNKVVQTLAKAFARKGYWVLCPNLCGVGGSEGQFDYGMGEADDMAAVLAWARQQQPQATALPLMLAGFSFGTFVQAQLAARLQQAGEPAPAMMLAGPAVGRFPLASVPPETLVVHGEEDEVVPLADVLAWARPQKLSVVVLPGVSHFFHGHLGQLSQWVDIRWPG